MYILCTHITMHILVYSHAWTYIATFVVPVIRDLDLLERDLTSHPVSAIRWGVGVDIPLHVWVVCITLAHYDPL